ncbi:transglutaminase family protein [Microlunatus panaciterrae]|uniref:Transglutaminase-like putative cysteine protease n=1 Tax=Microlunatus panaciterrae TaxID=400768 RepID=A0ABS2RPC6_9ACTN|nr:transglutaminase family protein [Microlunatus panaciterrae]MBM7799789.1 transglutaminase-like putative cysteine protease [Microlunatus panaciterrae]
MTDYRIRHTTRYSYDGPVSGSYGLFHLRPRDLPWQQCRSHDVRIEPAAADVFRHCDVFGNDKTYFHVIEPHTVLEVTAVSEVQISPQQLPPDRLSIAWERARPDQRLELPDAWQAVDYTFATPLVDLPDEVHDYARRSFPAGRPLGEAATELMHRIHADFDYQSGSSSVTSRVTDLLRSRSGVCQDFAHFLVACLRSQGLAGRYVSGYLATRPPPGQPRLVGADASHAWAGCWVPGAGWLYLDPTNDRLTDEAHATVAFGRDYGDVPPVKGVIFTKAKESNMTVSVDMAPVPRADSAGR